jgi:hypothetical protein
MTSIIKVDNLQNQCGANIINENAGTITIGASGDTVTLAAGASQSGFGRSGSVNWDTTPKTTGFTAVSGNGYFCDTTSAAFTVTLPATPSAGDIVAIADYNGTALTNAITIARNSSNINGAAADQDITFNYAAVTFVYVDSTVGWRSVDTSNLNDIETQPAFIVATGGTVLTCGDFKTHVFTGPGTFTVSCAGNPLGSDSVDYLVVAGGGSGGKNQGGGGGAGGYRQNYPSPTTAGLPVTAQGYPITVGSGGARPACSNTPGDQGNNSIFSTITSTGGGGGSNAATPSTSLTGGSGGGGDPNSPGSAGNTPPVSPSQGNPGGDSSNPNGAGGGGGASAAGGSSSTPTAGSGGDGSPIATAFFGPTSPSYGTPGPAPGRYFAGGGGGSAHASPGIHGTGGAGGGGQGGGTSNPQPTGAGTVNTGGGGGGNGNNDASTGAGGSGIVIIRYKFQ